VAEVKRGCHRRGPLVSILGLLLLVSGASRAEAATGVQLQLIVSGVPSVVDIQHADSGGRLFLVSQPGQVLILESGTVRSTPFVDVSALVLYNGEQGLLGLTFHPQYQSNGYFFLNYTSSSGDTVVARYKVSDGDANVADPLSASILLTMPQPFGNHKGGQLAFGPDGYLYISVGDGGSGGDPLNHGQRLDSLLGKILRIDVDSGSPYAIPGDNPYAQTPGVRPEIWASGLRNPWRFSFDRETGEMFIADVGQSAWEEVNYQPAAGGGGRNYGWRLMEGRHCYNPSSGCNMAGLIQPIVEYGHPRGCSITGGYRYRGTALTGYQGSYFFSDVCTGVIYAASLQSGGTWHITQLLDSPHPVSTFGQGPDGELYLASYRDSGAIYRLTLSSSSVMRLTLRKSGAGTVATSNAALECGDVCAIDVTPGTTFGLVATAGAGSAFASWLGDADCADGSVTMSADRTCTALFGGPFTDPSLTPGASSIRAVHISELRTRIDALRIAAGLPAYGWTDAELPPLTVVKAVHLAELRTALGQAYTANQRTLQLTTDPGSLLGLPIRAAHILELREAVVGLESG
jgi:glucose/arabinose dehydrogenase